MIPITLLVSNNTYYNIIKTGKTTIEIVKNGLCKRNCFIHNNFFKYSNTYITDCNDIEFKSSDILKYLEIDNINTTNLFLNSIIINQKYDFCIIIGGINSRINMHYPKSLMNIHNIFDDNFDNNFDDIILTKIIKNILNYANNIYICCNNYYKDFYINYQKKLKYNNIKFLYFNSINNLQTYPYGNAETIFQLLQAALE